jgi:flagellar hook assembly protein FlgD
LPRIATIVLVLALLGGTAAAFTVTQELKSERSPVARPGFDRVFAPTCDCPRATASLSVTLRKADEVTASIVDADGSAVRTLLADERRPRGRLTLEWDGRTDAGELAPDGRYRLQLHLADQRRTILLPTTVQLDATPPRVRLVGVRPDTLSPDGDGIRERAAIVYRSSEQSRVLVTVAGGRLPEVEVVRSRVRPPGREKVHWFGKVDGEPLPRGTYTLTIRAEDAAGNRSEPVTATVRIRYVELDEERYVVRPGGTLRFRVSTDVATFRWHLFRPREGRPGRPIVYDENASGDEVAVVLPSTLEPGEYLLRVTANGRRDRASVVVLGAP